MRDVVEKIGGPAMAVQSPRWEPSADWPRFTITGVQTCWCVRTDSDLQSASPRATCVDE